MKLLLALLSLSIAGCRTAAPATPPSPLAKLAAEPRPITTPASQANIELHQKVTRQAQLIDALLSENEALSARPAAVPAAEVKPNTSVASPPPPPVPMDQKSTGPIVVPNADGVIDLAAVKTALSQGEAVNPFATRSLSGASTREVTLQVGGIIAGPVACAVINDRLVQAGDTVESLVVDRIESDAVFLRDGEHRLRLPVSEKPARVRLAF